MKISINKASVVTLAGMVLGVVAMEKDNYGIAFAGVAITIAGSTVMRIQAQQRMIEYFNESLLATEAKLNNDPNVKILRG